LMMTVVFLPPSTSIIISIAPMIMREAIVLRIYNKIPSRIYTFFKIFGLVWLVVRVDIPQIQSFS
jgi:hypothetical protein